LLYLYVPYKEKDEAKALGAKWDANKKRWFVANRNDYPLFAKWFFENNEICETQIIMDNFYIVVGKGECWKCHNTTNIIGLGIAHYFTIDFDDDNEAYSNISEGIDNTIHISPIAQGFSKKFMDKLSERFNFKKGYSKTIGNSYFANHCQHCNSLQGNFFIFDEVDSPFFIDTKEAAEQLLLYEVKLKYDIALSTSLCWGSEDELINLYAKVLGYDDPIYEIN